MSYNPKNIFITGGAGFIASHVVVHLVKTYPQYNIINFDKMDYCSSLKNVEEVANKPNYKFIRGDICSEDFIDYVFKTEQIDTIMHFAAQSHVDNSFGNSIAFTKNNIEGTHVLLEAAKINGISRFVHVSTDEVYGEAGTEGNEEEAHTESTLLAPTNPYSATKAGAEFMVKAYAKSFKIPIIITRGNNVYGPGQFPEKIIPKFIQLLTKGKPCFIHGTGTNKRSFIYISDVVSAFDAVLHRGKLNEIYNIGTTREISNMKVANDLIEAFGLTDKKEEFLKFVEDRPYNDFRYSVNFEKLTSLGWEANISWEDGLKKTIEWYKANPAESHWEAVEQVMVAHPRIALK